MNYILKTDSEIGNDKKLSKSLKLKVFDITLESVIGSQLFEVPTIPNFHAEGLKPFPFLSQGIFGEKPFPEFLKAFPDLKVIGKTFPATSKTFPSRQMRESFP